MPTRIQAVLLSKTPVGRRGAERIVRAMGKSFGEAVDTTKRYYRIRVRSPAWLRKKGYRRFRLKRVKPGMTLIVAAKGPKPNPGPKLQAAYRYLNLMRNAAKRRYGFLYLAWLRNGAVGREPERGKLSVMGAQAVRMGLHEILGHDPFTVARS